MSGKEKIEVADEDKLKITPDKEEGDYKGRGTEQITG